MRTQTRHAVHFLAAPLLGGLLIAHCGCNAMSGHAMNQTGMVYYRQGQYAKARNEFQRAMLDNPGNANYSHNMASAMKKQGDWAGAEQMYRTALNTDPSHQPSYHGLASLLKDQGRSEESIDLIQTWAATQPQDPSAHIEMAWLQREYGDLTGAEHSLRTALKQKPNHPIALAQLGQIYQDSGQYDRAVAMYKRSLHNHWNQPEVRSRLAALKRSPAMRYASRQAYPYRPAGYSQTATLPPGPISLAIPNADPAHTTHAGVQPIVPQRH